MRNMTISEGKTTAVMVDFIDLTNPYFARHSKQRLKVYRSEEAFVIRAMEMSESMERVIEHVAAT